MPAGQNSEIMTFRYLKTLVFDKSFKKLQHCLMFSFLKSRVLFVITNPLFLSSWLFDFVPLYTLIHFGKIDMTTENSGGFIRFPPLFRGDDAMKYMVLNGLGRLLFSSLLSMLFLMVFRFTVMDFIWMQEPSIFFKKWTK